MKKQPQTNRCSQDQTNVHLSKVYIRHRSSWGNVLKLLTGRVRFRGRTAPRYSSGRGAVRLVDACKLVGRRINYKKY